jgi:hypothetical protein
LTQAKEKRPGRQANQGPNMRRIMPKAQTTDASRQNTNAGEVQVHVATDQRKAVAGWLHLGAAAPRVRPHPCHRLLGPLSSGGAINAPRVGFGGFPNLSHPNRPWCTI